MAHNRRAKNVKGREGRRSNTNALVPTSGAEHSMDGIVVASNDAENSGSIDNRDSGVSSSIPSPRMLRHRESEENTLRTRTRNSNAARCGPGKMQQANGNSRSHIASSTSLRNGATSSKLPMRPERSDTSPHWHSQDDALATRRQKSKDSEEERSRFELETRIAWIRRHYREQEVLLEEQIERLEETYNLARAELDPRWRAGEEEAQVRVDSADDWDSMSDYTPTEPRGKSRSPSPVFAVRVRVASS